MVYRTAQLKRQQIMRKSHKVMWLPMCGRQLQYYARKGAQEESLHICRFGHKPEWQDSRLFLLKPKRKCTAVIKCIRSETFLQKNINKGVKNGLVKLDQILHRISLYRWSWAATEDAQKAVTTAIPAENTAK